MDSKGDKNRNQRKNENKKAFKSQLIRDLKKLIFVL